jgi:hypothetical protein
VFWAVVLFLFKFGLDWVLSETIFGRPWNIWNYFRAQNLMGGALRGYDPLYYGALLLLSLPFLWAGVVITLRRLRSARLPEYLVLLFFVPVIKLLLFAVLAAVPEPKTDSPPQDDIDRFHGFFGRFVPAGPVGAAAMGIVLSLAFAALAVWMGTKVLKNYGWTLFVGLPFWIGFSSALVFGYHQRRRLSACLNVSLLAILAAGAAMLAVAFEGLICLIMAAPIAIGMSLAGGAVAYRLQASGLFPYQRANVLGLMILAIPSIMNLEARGKAQAPALQVTSRVIVNAPPERVWPHVVAFTELPPPEEWLFRVGIAYPIRAEIHGHGVGAVRHCEFSTGPFVEPIHRWEPPTRLSFSVASNPAPMQEWTPYDNVRPPHIDGFLVSRQGEFRLKWLPDGKTCLEGTTEYQHHMWPVWYWKVWADYIIHKIHLRVLRHVKALAEREPSA